MRLRYLLPLIAFLLGDIALAQVAADTARGLVGEEVRLAIRAAERIEAVDSLVLRGSFHLGNATVFYPERFVAGSRATLVRSSLERTTDSTYDFLVVLAPLDTSLDAGDTLFLLAGEALAGYDSVCRVRFDPFVANDSPAPEIVGVIVTRSIGSRLPYVRYATLEPGYPNPAVRYQTVSWAFRIDKASPVRFGIYNLLGELISDHDLGELGPGIYIERFTIGFDVPTGTYVVKLGTNSGDAWQWMHVVK